MSAAIHMVAYGKRDGKVLYKRNFWCRNVGDATHRLLRDGFKRCSQLAFKKEVYLRLDDGVCRYVIIEARICDPARCPDV